MLISRIRSRGDLKPWLDRRAGPSTAPVLCVVAAALAFSGCGAPTAHDITVSMKDFMFSPVAITVARGTTVHWKNLDGVPYSIVGFEEPFHSGVLDQNDLFTFKFSSPGTYRYVCSLHPQMIGTIVVK
jgi:plastocyanin